MSSGRRSACATCWISPYEESRPGAVAADLAALAHHPELQGEPEHLGDELQRARSPHPAYGVPGRPVERGEPVVGQAVAVAEHLVQDVGLRRVERHRVVPDVLGGVEDPVGQRPVELGQRDQPGGGHVAEPGQRAQQLVDLGELRDPGLGQAEPLLALQVGGTGQPLVQPVQLGADDAPDLVLGLGVGRRSAGGVPGCHSRASAASALRRARYSGSTAPGWLSPRWTVTPPSSPRVTGA